MDELPKRPAPEEVPSSVQRAALSTSLKTLTSVEADFRANGRDGNHVNGFWTGDSSGPYYVRPNGGEQEIRLIEESLANADAKPLFPCRGDQLPGFPMDTRR